MIALLPPLSRAITAATCLIFSSLPIATAQNLSLGVTEADRILRNGILPENLDLIFDPTMDGAIKGSVGYAASASASYDSNTSLSSTNEQDDVILSLSPSVGYTSDPEGAARYVFNAYYSPSYKAYLEDSGKGGLNQSGGVSLSTSGARTSISAFFNRSQSSGADRITGGYSETVVHSGGISASYKLAPRTSIQASATAASSDYSTGETGSEIYSTKAGLSWDASELLALGSSFRYKRSESTTSGVRTAMGISFDASYLVTDRIDFFSSIGIESVENSRSSDGSEPSVFGEMGLSYALNEIWSSQASINLVSLPSATSSNYVINDLSFQAGISRSLLQGSLKLSAAYSIPDFQEVGPTVASNNAGDVLEVMLSYGRPIFSERIGFATAVSYSCSDWGDDWSRWLFTTGISIQF